MPDALQPVTSANAPRYRYYTVDIVSNKIIGEIPFEDVSYERSLKQPGAFDGKITISEQTNALDLYNATLPGKTAIYVVRDGKAVWGGIIWGRTYDMVGRSLAVSASEFTSYLSHRIIWKAYSNVYTADLTKETKTSPVLVVIKNAFLKAPLSVTDEFGNPTKVEVTFVSTGERKYTGFYPVLGTTTSPSAISDPRIDSFYVDIPKLPVPSTGIYNNVSVNVRVDTYGYLRDLLDNVFNDFINLDFPNEIIEPGITKQIDITTKQLTISNNVYGVATIQCSEPHDLVVGQRVELYNVDRMLDGVHTVTEIPTNKSVKFIVNNPVDARDRNTPIYLDNTLSNAVDLSTSIQRTPISMRQSVEYLKENVTYVKRDSGTVTVTLASPHQFEVGTKLHITMADKKPVMMSVYDSAKKKNVNTNTMKYNGNQAVEIIAVTDTTVSYKDPKYTAAKYNIPLTKLSPLDLNKNYVESSESRNFLRLYSKPSHGFNINDRIRVEGVDSVSWGYPRYNGNHRIFEVDGGVPYIVKQFEIVSDDVYGTIIKFYITKTNALDINRDITCREGDNFLVAGMSGALDYLNDTYRAIADVQQDGTYWVISADGPSEPVALTTLTDNPTLSVNGTNWIQYTPVQSSLRGALTKEPDTIFPVTNLKYTPAKGKTPNIVTITTNGRHLLSVGDSVKVELSTAGTDSKDNDTYGGTYTVTAINDADKFSYSLRKTKDGKAVTLPTVAINQAKTGQITRFKTSLDISKELVTARIDSVTTIQNGDSYKAYVYSPNHNLVEGDVIRIMFDNEYFSNLANDGEDIEINEVVNENTFAYITDAQVGTTKHFPLVGIEFNKSTYLATNEIGNVAVANSIYYQLKGYTETIDQPEVKANVVSLSTNVVQYSTSSRPTTFTTITCDADLSALIVPDPDPMTGANFVLDNLPAATYGTVEPTLTHPSLDSFYYSASNPKAVVFTFTTPHGIDPTSDLGNGTKVTINTGPYFLVYPDFADKVSTIGSGIYGVNMLSSGIYGQPLSVAQVLDDYRVACYFGGFGATSFTAKNLTKVNSALTPSPTYPVITGISYANNIVTVTFATEHYLSSTYDIGAQFAISGFASTVSATNNSTGATLDTSWLNGGWSVRTIPSSNSITFYSGYKQATPSVSIYNIGSIGLPSTATYTRTATLISHALNASKIGISLSSPVPVTINANTSVTITSINSYANYPYDTDRVGGVNTSVIAGSKTLYPAESNSGYLVVGQAGYTPAFTLYGSAAASAQIVISQVSSGTYVPTPSATLTPNPYTGSSPFSTTITYGLRPVELTPDLSKYNKKTFKILKVETNKVTFYDPAPALGYSGGTVNLTSFTPKPTFFVGAQTWVATGAPSLAVGDEISISGLQDDYSFLNDYYLTVLDYWLGADIDETPTAYVRVKNNYYTDSRKTMPANKTSGLPTTATMSSAANVPGTAYVVPRQGYEGSFEVTHVARSSDGITATVTSPGHNFAVGDEVYVVILGLQYAAFSQNLQRIKVTSVTDETFSYALNVNTKIKSFSGSPVISLFEKTTGTNEIKFSGSGAHNLVTGDVVTVSGVSAYLNGSQTVVNTSSGSVSFNTTEVSKFTNKATVTGAISVSSYASVDADVSGFAISAPVAIREPQMLYRTYGEYPNNSSIGGLTFSDNNYSSKTSTTTPIYGSQLLTVAQILEGYSNSLDGFDYRIEVSLDSDVNGTKTFNRKFMLLPIYPPTLTEYLLTLPDQKLAKGQVAHPKAFGADKLIFEYPGNISNVSMRENAESAATRIFVVGSDNKAGSGSEVAYSGASEVKLLADGWPVLDKKESQEWPVRTAQSAYVDPIDNYDDETGYWQYAERFLKESKPPVGDFIISVNGSLNPVIGSYNPGDWCSIVINDNFVKTRLNSVLEPRKDVIVRKIDSIKVQVPNNPAFPEQIDLQLVTDWQVDKIGE